MRVHGEKGWERTLHVHIIHARSSLLQFNVPLQSDPVRIIFLELLPLLHFLRYERLPNHIVPRFGLRDMYPIDHGVDLASLQLALHALREKEIAGFGFEVHNAFVGVARDLDVRDVGGGDDFVDEGTRGGDEVVETGDVDFVDHEHDGFAGKEGFDGVEEFALS